MPSKDRSFHDSPEETGVEAWLSSELHQPRPFAMTMSLYVANSSFTSINMSCNRSSPGPSIDADAWAFCMLGAMKPLLASTSSLAWGQKECCAECLNAKKGNAVATVAAWATP